MKIEDVKFIQLKNNQLGLVMSGGHLVTKQTLLFAYAAVHANWDKLDWSVKQTSKSILGSAWGDPAIWGYNQALGRCVKFFMKHHMLPESLEIARKRNGEQYKGGSAQYVKLGTNPSPAAFRHFIRRCKTPSVSSPRLFLKMPVRP